MAEQILKNTRSSLETTFSVGDADGAVTVTITRADGATLTTGSATNEVEAGRYTFVLAPQAELDLLKVVWSGAWGGVTQSVTNYAEIVGDYLFPLAEARTFGDQALSNSTTYPDTAIRAARERITDLFEQVCKTSFVPRYARDTLDGTATESLRVYKHPVSRVIAASVNGTAFTSGDIANIAVRPSGILILRTGVWGWAFGGKNIIISYEHGYSSAPPDIQQAALMLTRYELVSNELSDRALSVSTEYGVQSLATAGGPMNNPTNLPYVNSVLARYVSPDSRVA